jgi:Lipocalin-like domain
MGQRMLRSYLSQIARISTLIVIICCANASPAQTSAPDTSANEVIGTWTLLSVDNVRPDGTRAPRHGNRPAGLLMFDASGHYSLIVLTQGTPEEYKAALEGDNCDYGRYTVNQSDHSITFYMDHANHRELENSSHTRYYTLQGDELRYTTVRLSAGGKSTGTFGEVVLRRTR